MVVRPNLKDFYLCIGIGMGCIYAFKHLKKYFYVGSTKNKLNQRLAGHRHMYKTECDYLVYCYMRKHMINFDNMDVDVLMEGVENWTLEFCEQEFIDIHQPETNMLNPMHHRDARYPKYRYDWLERRYNLKWELPFSQLDSS